MLHAIVTEEDTPLILTSDSKTPMDLWKTPDMSTQVILENEHQNLTPD